MFTLCGLIKSESSLAFLGARPTWYIDRFVPCYAPSIPAPSMRLSPNPSMSFASWQSIALLPHSTRSRNCLSRDMRQLHAAATSFAGHNRVSDKYKFLQPAFSDDPFSPTLSPVVQDPTQKRCSRCSQERAILQSRQCESPVPVPGLGTTDSHCLARI